METISISNLKAHLSSAIKRVRSGVRITVMDHNHPVAALVPLENESIFVRTAEVPYKYRKLKPLVQEGPGKYLAEERTERW